MSAYKVTRDETIRAITILSYTEDGLTISEAIAAAEEVLETEGDAAGWEYTDAERINHDRVTVRFVAL